MDKHVNVVKVHVARLAAGGDLAIEVVAFLKKHGISFGSVSIIGALKNATMGAYSFEKREYRSFHISEEMEILQCGGNVSILDGEAFAHLHMTLSREDGSVLGGHLFEGSEIHVAEITVLEFDGEPPVRQEDPHSGLKLWEQSG